MARTSNARTEVEQLLNRYTIILGKIADLRREPVNELFGGVSSAVSEHRDALVRGDSNPSLAAIRTGLRQGLRDMPEFLRFAGVSDSEIESIMAAADAAVASAEPHWNDQQHAELHRVLKKGKIRNEDEFYLLRWRLDQIEGRPGAQEEEAALMTLLDRYEFG